MKPIFLCHFNKLSLVTVLIWKSFDFQNCLTTTCICQSTCFLQSKPHEQEPKEIPRCWVCYVHERKPSLRFMSRVYLCGKAKSKGSCTVFQTPKHRSSSVLFCRAPARTLDVATHPALTRWRAGAVPGTPVLVGYVGC